jgi:peptide chain release factor 1
VALMRAALCACRQVSIGASASATVFSCESLDETPSSLTLEVRGKKAATLFSHESGGHRWQRVPPSEKRGRRHTSTVTIAVLPVDVPASTAFDEREIEWTTTVGGGPGGQARNKTANAVHAHHIPSGLRVRVESERSLWQNKRWAEHLLYAKLTERYENERLAKRNHDRREQVGSGQRGDKIRTVRVQDGMVVDHVSGKKMQFARYERGHIEELW